MKATLPHVLLLPVGDIYFFAMLRLTDTGGDDQRIAAISKGDDQRTLVNVNGRLPILT